jgi:uncharacterized membrane protein
MIGVEIVYRLAGIVLAVVAFLNARDKTNPKRFTTALFWGAYSATLLFGSKLPDFVNGCLVIVLVVVGGMKQLGRSAPLSDAARTEDDDRRKQSAAKHKNRLFVPALLVPALTLAFSLSLKNVRVNGVLLIDPKNLSLIALATSAMIALIVALVLLRQPLTAPATEARRLLDLVGWAAVIPQMLAALGALFAIAGVGDRIAELLGRFVPLDNRFVVVLTYTAGMALFTWIMGNAFAAFPVMTAAVGIPLIVRKFGGDPAIMAAIGMLSGFCGTLMTPMAANFNIVPAALLELPDERGVIRVQVPTALMILGANTILMYVLLFR